MCCAAPIRWELASRGAGGPLGEDRHVQHGGWRHSVNRDLGRPFSQKQGSSFWSVLRNLLYPEDAVTDTLPPELSCMSQTEGRRTVQSRPHPVSPGSVHGSPKLGTAPCPSSPFPSSGNDPSGWHVLFLSSSSPSLGRAATLSHVVGHHSVPSLVSLLLRHRSIQSESSYTCKSHHAILLQPSQGSSALAPSTHLENPCLP